jgi:hypothetical protein
VALGWTFLVRVLTVGVDIDDYQKKFGSLLQTLPTDTLSGNDEIEKIIYSILNRDWIFFISGTPTSVFVSASMLVTPISWHR